MPMRHSAAPQLQGRSQAHFTEPWQIPVVLSWRWAATNSSTPSPGLVGHFGEVALTIGFGRARLSPPIPQPPIAHSEEEWTAGRKQEEQWGFPISE